MNIKLILMDGILLIEVVFPLLNPVFLLSN
jgi:hypothetical protein